MTVYYDPLDRPVEIARGRGDLRYSSTYFNPNIRQAPGYVPRIGKTPVSYAKLFAEQPYIATAVMRMLTWSVRVPLKVYRRKDNGETREQVQPDEHPLARIVKRPWLGKGASPAALVMSLLGPTLVHGNTVIEIEVVGGEEWLKPLDWRDLTPLGVETTGELDGWRWCYDGYERDIPLSKSVHIAWWSPLGPLGISPLEQLGITLGIEDAAQRFQKAMFGNAARPPSAITSTTDFLQLERPERQGLMEQLRRDIADIYTGPENAGKPALLPPGLDWKPVGSSAHEAELIEQRKVAREEVAAVYQIPPPMIGILDHATYSNIEVMREMAYTMALGPPLVLIEQTLTATLARDYFGEDDLYVEFDFGPVLRGDRQTEIATFRDGIASGIQTMNEARRALNLPPSPEPDADRLFYPGNNLKPVGDAKAEAEAAAQQEAAPMPLFDEPPPPDEVPAEDEIAVPQGATAMFAASDFVEKEHPRGPGGKFKDKLGLANLSKLTTQQLMGRSRNGDYYEFKRAAPEVQKAAIGELERRGMSQQAETLRKQIGGKGGGKGEPGSKENPIDCGTDVEKAAQALGEGKFVKLDEVREVSTLLKKLGEMAQDAIKKGDKAPTYDLCKVTVPKTNLFCAKTKGVPRVEMPQLGGIPIKGSKADKLPKNDEGGVDLSELFVHHLQDMGIDVVDEEERASHLKATQNQLNGAKVAGIAGAIRDGKDLFKGGGLFVSESGYVIDGHHRWAAKVGVDADDGDLTNDTKMPVRRIKADIIFLLAEANKFAEEWGIPQAAVGQFTTGGKAMEFGENWAANWVEKAGGLPRYIKEIADALQRGGMSESRAIATAVNRCKKWCAGEGDVHPDTRAKACAAVAEWEAKKAGRKVALGPQIGVRVIDGHEIPVFSTRRSDDDCGCG